MKIEFPRWRRESTPPVMPAWQRNIQHAHLFLAEDILALQAVEKDTPEEEGLAFRVATRVGNLSFSLIEAYRQHNLKERFPEPFLLREEIDTVTYYIPFRNQVRILRMGKIRRRLPIMRSDFDSGTEIPLKEWGKNEELRGRILDSLMGLIPRSIRDG